jgi:hypothetical protein
LQPQSVDSARSPAPIGGRMSHEIAKLLLEHAETFLERKEAVKSALALGMPLAEIEAYLDWLDSLRTGSPRQRDLSVPDKQGRGAPRPDEADEA